MLLCWVRWNETQLPFVYKTEGNSCAQAKFLFSGDSNSPIVTRNNSDYSASIRKSYKKYICKRVQGQATTLQDNNSEVKLHIPAGAHGLVLGCVHTSFERFLSVVPEEECFIAPVPDYVFIADDKVNVSEPEFCLQIPCTLSKETLSKSVKVRHGDIHTGKIFQLISDSSFSDGPFYEVVSGHVNVYTRHFSQFICSSCEATCKNHLKAITFGDVFKCNEHWVAGVRLYIGNNLYNIADFSKVGSNNAWRDLQDLKQLSQFESGLHTSI